MSCQFVGIFLKFDILLFFEDLSTVQVPLQSDSNNRYCTCSQAYESLWQYLSQFCLEWEMCKTEVLEKINTHILRSVAFFNENLSLFQIMWKNMVQATGESIIRRMRFACWIPKATDTLRICNTCHFSTATMVTRTRLSVTFILTLSVTLRVTSCRYIQ